MIHYHGTPITPLTVHQAALTGRHAFVSFATGEGQIAFAASVCQSFAIDNGAFTIWKQGGTLDLEGYAAFIREYQQHPGYDFHLAPDSIEGSEQDQSVLLAQWRNLGLLTLDGRCVPVWHLHESLERLGQLCRAFPRVALGSSGEYAEIGTPQWKGRMADAMDAICDEDGRPPCKLHGLRMLNPSIFTKLPLSSADSTNVAQNHNRERKLYGMTPTMAGLKIVDRIEQENSASVWNRAVWEKTDDFQLELVG